MHRWISLIAVATLLAACAPPLAAEDRPEQPVYLLRIVLSEEVVTAAGEAGERKLSAPTISTRAGQSAEFHVGGTAILGDEEIDFGTQMKVQVDPRPEGKVELRGKLENSALARPDDESAVRTATTLYLRRTLELGKSVRIPVAGQPRRWCEITVERFEKP